MVEGSQEWVTRASIAGFGVASAGVWAVSITFRKLLNRDSVWIPFIAAMLIAFGLARNAEALNNWLDWLVAFINGCLLFCSASGINETAVNAVTKKPAGMIKPQAARPVTWFQSWFR